VKLCHINHIIGPVFLRQHRMVWLPDGETSSSAVAERQRDASRLLLVSFNSTIHLRRAQSSIIGYRCVQLNSVLFSSLRHGRPCCKLR